LRESGPANRWTIYPPLSALPQAIGGSGLGMTLWLVSMAIFIASSLMGSLNYIVTVINLRTEGMSMTRLPLTIWAFFVTAIIGVVSFPVLLSAALLILIEVSAPLFSCLIFILLVKCYIIKVDRLFYLSTYFGF
jgi:cytochrome c oxidase subunit 1